MFRLNMYQCATGSISDYNHAAEFFNKCKAKRSSTHLDERPILGKETSKQMGVRMTAGGVVKFRYHSLDVVSWNPDNSVTLRSFPSSSTCVFANCFVPCETHITKEFSVMKHGHFYYPIHSEITIGPDREVHQPEINPAIFRKKRVNQKIAKGILATTRYDEYRKWYNLMKPILEYQERNQSSFWYADHTSTYLDFLEDEDDWHDLMVEHNVSPNILRDLIYRRHKDEVFYYEEEDRIPFENCYDFPRSWEVHVK